MVLVTGALAAKGALRGFFREACGLLALASGIACVLFLAPTVEDALLPYWPPATPGVRAASKAMAFLGPYVLAQALGFLLYRLGRTIRLGGLDRLAGLSLGATTGILLSGGGLHLLASTGWGRPWLEGSVLGRPVADICRRVAEWALGLGA